MPTEATHHSLELRDLLDLEPRHQGLEVVTARATLVDRTNSNNHWFHPDCSCCGNRIKRVKNRLSYVAVNFYDPELRRVELGDGSVVTGHDGVDTILYHPDCYEDAGKTFGEPAPNQPADTSELAGRLGTYSLGATVYITA